MTVPTPTELEGLLGRATPGPWKAFTTGEMRDFYVGASRPGNEARFDSVLSEENGARNAALIANMRNALPSLLARIKELEAENAAAGRNIYRMQEVSTGLATALRTIAEHKPISPALAHVVQMRRIARAALTLNRSENDGRSAFP